MQIFFYGLFMDEHLLAAQGIQISSHQYGFVSDFGLRIAARATLVRSPGERTYGVVADIDSALINALYSDDSVSDYVPETLTAELQDGGAVDAICYNLPEDKITGANPGYAAKLLELATRLGFPADYCEQIRRYV